MNARPVFCADSWRVTGSRSPIGPAYRWLMGKRGRATDTQKFTKAAAAKSERVRELIAKLQEQQKATLDIDASGEGSASGSCEGSVIQDADYAILNKTPNDDLLRVSSLFDVIDSSSHTVHAALLWPHVPPRS